MRITVEPSTQTYDPQEAFLADSTLLSQAEKIIVQFSSGTGSWAAGRRVADEHGTSRLTLLFADVGEDEDNYRFLHDAHRDIGGELVTIADGRGIWDVYFDEHRMGSSQVAPCSKELKQVVCRKWLEANCNPATTVLVIGIDWSEDHRLPGIQENWYPYRVVAPMMHKPYMDKDEVFAWCRSQGFEPPRLNTLGFAHANCGGFCCRMGHAQAEHLLQVFPERYAFHENKEQAFRDKFGWDVSIMKDRRGGTTKPLTLRSFRERLGVDAHDFDAHDWGGCNCFGSD